MESSVNAKWKLTVCSVCFRDAFVLYFVGGEPFVAKQLPFMNELEIRCCYFMHVHLSFCPWNTEWRCDRLNILTPQLSLNGHCSLSLLQSLLTGFDVEEMYLRMGSSM